jgi:hypothetical protein
MAKPGRHGASRPGRRGASRGGDDDGDRDDHGHEGHHEHEPYDDPSEHLEIEQRRFAVGLPPTPELYALAREQWYRLAGVLTRPSMDPVTGKPASGDAQPPDQSHPGERETGQ